MKITKEGLAVIAGDNYLSAEIIAQGRLNVAHAYLLQFRQYIPEGGIVVDVGACLGDFTATFSEFVGPTGKVHAFEPNHEVFECLSHNMSKYPNVVHMEYALGQGPKQVSMTQDHHNIGASYISGDNGNVIVVPLDACRLKRVDFIKIDAEGYEPYVLAGAQETIRRLRPVMLIEIDQRALGFQNFIPKDIHSSLDALGYNFPRFDGAHGNILCLPKEHVR